MGCCGPCNLQLQRMNGAEREAEKRVGADHDPASGRSVREEAPDGDCVDQCRDAAPRHHKSHQFSSRIRISYLGNHPVAAGKGAVAISPPRCPASRRWSASVSISGTRRDAAHQADSRAIGSGRTTGTVGRSGADERSLPDSQLRLPRIGRAAGVAVWQGRGQDGQRCDRGIPEANQA